MADALLPAVLKAGCAIMECYSGDTSVRYKRDSSPVTDADEAAEAIILRELMRLFPEIPVVAEEKTAAGSVPAIAGTFFLVDPLDGTKEFVARTGEFTINIALVEDGVPVFGAIYAPALGEYYVTPGHPRAVMASFMPDTPAKEAAARDYRPLTGERRENRAAVALMSRSHRSEETGRFLSGLPPHETLTLGSSLKFCALAKGDADVYPRFGPTSEWDVAAGHAILNAAGGTVTSGNGTALTYGKASAGFINENFVAWRRMPGGNCENALE